MAGVLGVQLGGANIYDGVRVQRARLGSPRRALVAERIPESLCLMWTTTALAVGLALLWLR